ncbi:MAG: hypothetical protein ACE5NG_09875 [bacterium]
MHEYFFHPEAAEDYVNAYAWYAKHSQKIAQEFEREIIYTIVTEVNIKFGRSFFINFTK